MDYKEYYIQQKYESEKVFDSSLDGKNNPLINASNIRLHDLAKWTEILSDRFEHQIYQNALTQFQFTMQALNFGFYSISFFGLRFLLERFLVGILLSSNEYRYRLWKQESGYSDISWASILDADDGIYSKRFSDAFFPELRDELNHYKGLTKKVYRECSEFVHGNHHTIHKVPERIAYDDDLFKSWHEKANIIFEILFFTLNLRYSNFINRQSLLEIEDINIDHLNFIKPIRNLHD